MQGLDHQISLPPLGLPYDWHCMPVMRSGLSEVAEAEPLPSPLTPPTDK